MIEGLTKHKDPRIRAYSAKGLGKLGPHTFRVLLFGFHDEHPTVRGATENAMLKLNVEDINSYFWDNIP